MEKIGEEVYLADSKNFIISHSCIASVFGERGGCFRKR